MKIFDEAFTGCTNLTEVQFKGDYLEYLGVKAFYDCTMLNEINIPEGIGYINREVFKNCSSLENFIIPVSVVSINNEAFENSGLESIVISENVSTIGNYAFKNCKNVETLTVKSSLVSIGKEAFLNLSADVDPEKTSINTMIDLSSVKYIGHSAFQDCKYLKFNAIIDSIGKGKVAYNDNLGNAHSSMDIGDKAFMNCLMLETVIINSDTNQNFANTYEETFKGCTGLKSAVLNVNITRVDYRFFQGCTSLESVSISTTQKLEIQQSAFEDCKALSTLNLPEVDAIGNYAFDGCTSLESITIPEDVTSIGFMTFNDCTSLKSVTIHENVTSIGQNAFQDCTSLTTITIPGNVTSIKSGAFKGCSSLNQIIIKDVSKIKTADDRCFELGSEGIVDVYVNVNTVETSLSEHFWLSDNLSGE